MVDVQFLLYLNGVQLSDFLPYQSNDTQTFLKAQVLLKSTGFDLYWNYGVNGVSSILIKSANELRIAVAFTKAQHAMRRDKFGKSINMPITVKISVKPEASRKKAKVAFTVESNIPATGDRKVDSTLSVHSFTLRTLENGDCSQLSFVCRSRANADGLTYIVASAIAQVDSANCGLERYGKNFVATMNTTHLERVLTLMKSPLLTLRSSFDLVHLSGDMSYLTIRACSNALAKGSVTELMITPAKDFVDYTALFEIIDHLEPNKVDFYRRNYSDGLMRFFVGLADRVETVLINEHNKQRCFRPIEDEDKENEPVKLLKHIPLPIIRKMLSGKCSHLQINGRRYDLGLEHVVRLMDSFMKFNKKLSLILPTVSKHTMERMGVFREEDDDTLARELAPAGSYQRKKSRQPLGVQNGDFVVKTMCSRKILIAHVDKMLDDIQREEN